MALRRPSRHTHIKWAMAHAQVDNDPWYWYPTISHVYFKNKLRGAEILCHMGFFYIREV